MTERPDRWTAYGAPSLELDPDYRAADLVIPLREREAAPHARKRASDETQTQA